MKALAIQAQWRKVGVEARIVSVEFGSLLSAVSAGRFEVVLMRWTGVADPDILDRIFRSDALPPDGFNRGRFRDAGVDRLLRAARGATGPARDRLMKEVQARLAGLAPYAFLWWPDQVAALAPGVGLDLNGAGDFSRVFREGTP
jgi:peptide/nickel transport system substrate-binding protein